MTEITEGWLMKEFTARAKACQLSADCLGSGKLDSEIVIISEAPGVQEVSQAMPLVAGVLGSDPKDKNPVKKSEIEHWEGLLDWELDCLPNVKYIICLGNLSLHAITGEYGISNWRGSVVDCLVGRKRKLVKMLCTNNPSHILRNLAMVPMFNFDINKLKRVIDGTLKLWKPFNRLKMMKLQSPLILKSLPMKLHVSDLLTMHTQELALTFVTEAAIGIVWKKNAYCVKDYNDYFIIQKKGL